MRADLPVIAQHTRLGNITAPTLARNIAQFREEIKRFKEENRIQYQSRAYLRAKEDAAVFSEAVSSWDKARRDGGETLILGSTGDVLQGLGAVENDIYLRGEKINSILSDHPEMTLDEIKRIPEILDDPVLILKSKNEARIGTANPRLVMFGSIRAKNGQPVMVVLDLRPVENGLAVEDMQKITSAYTKTKNPSGFIQSSEVVHIEKDRAIPLLRSVGLQLRPTDLLQNGSIGSIDYEGTSVKITGVPFSDIVSAEQSQARALSTSPLTDREVLESAALGRTGGSSVSMKRREPTCQ